VKSIIDSENFVPNSSFIGADIFRLNFSHGEHQQKADLVDIIRAVEQKYDHPIAILADLQVYMCIHKPMITYVYDHVFEYVFILIFSYLSIYERRDCMYTYLSSSKSTMMVSLYQHHIQTQ
jgi:hypothetical protein